MQGSILVDTESVNDRTKVATDNERKTVSVKPADPFLEVGAKQENNSPHFFLKYLIEAKKSIFCVNFLYCCCKGKRESTAQRETFY